MERVAHLARRALGLSPRAPRHDWLKEDRTCGSNDAAANAAYCSNVVVTSKYTLLNFWPVFLLEQFSRFANFYFLVVCVLQSIKAISITAGLPTTALPLTIVIGFDAAVTAMEDIKRHKDDHRANTSRTLTMRGGRFSEVSWSELRVGDLLKVRRNEALPADCIFLASFSTDNDTPESCYVQTAQLDGETNLKLKQALAATPEVFASDAACAAFRGRVVCEAPNANFDKFTGMLHLQSAAGGDAQLPLPLEADQMLLRGCILRNVDSAYALVVYTGRETKVRVRQTTRARKVAQVEQMLNKLIAMLVATLVLACALGAIGAAAWSDAFSKPGWYLRQEATGPIDPSNSTVISGAEIIKQFFTFFLLNSSIIPVSLYVSVRLARTLQSVVMQWDREMFHDEPALFAASGGLEGEYPFKVRSMDLNDELGQITHIFSDKTGTLTLNYMEFRKLLVRGVAYGLGTTQIGVDRLRREGRDVTAMRAQLLAEEAERKAGGGRPVVPHVNFTDGSETHPGHTLEGDGADPRDGAQGAAVFSFLVHLAVNHNVLRETVRNHAGDVIGSRLSASSPDEEAFLFATDSFGLSFISRAHELALLRYRTGSARLPFARASRPLPAALRLASDAAIKKAMPAVGAGEGGAVLPVRLLATLAYSQERKRMSVIVQLPVLDSDGTPVLAPRSVADAESARVSGDIVLFCKGADSVILERLATGAGASSLDDYEVLQRSKRQMAEWGNDGLRTLCFASRVIPAQAFAEWQRRYQAACADLGEVQRRKAKQANRIDELMAEVESGLTLQGATANEDKLQPEVPETIALLAKGGVKIWMVTGDKQETAVNIGFATRLLDDTMRQVVATAESAGSTTAAMRRLRIAAKRMRAERLEDLARSAASASSFEAAIKWVGKQVEAAEAAMGVSPEAGAHTDIDIDAAELIMEADFDETGKMRPTLHRLATKASFRRSNSKRIVTNAAGAGSPRQGGGSGGGNDAPPFSGSSVKPAAEEADASSLASSSRRERENSLDSDDGEAAIAYADGNVALEAMGGAGAAPAPPPAAGGYSNPLRSPQARVAAVKLASEAIAPVLGQQRRPFALVIDEHALDTALSHPRLRAYLLYVAVNCGAVIACRARPDQKASVVRLIRHGVATSRTLAVGDGANDVDMIGTAHVGVGISGAEGVQAANASDYAIGRFRFLQRLLLVHGRWNYMRMSKLVLYMFWKNIFFVMSQFGFQVMNGYTGQKWYIEFGSQTFNLIYSSLPIIILAVYDRDLDASWVLRYPKLYDFSRLNRGLNVRVFASWYGDGFACAILNTIFTLACFSVPDVAGRFGDGATPYIFCMGALAFTNCVIVLSLRVAAEMNRHFSFFQGILLLSVLLWVPAVFLFDLLAGPYTTTFDYMSGGARATFGSAAFWLATLLFSGMLGAKIMGWKAFKRFAWPELRHIAQEAAEYTHDTKSIDEYTETADLARRTGKSYAEVVEARKMASSAATAIAPLIRSPKAGGAATAPAAAAEAEGAAAPPPPVAAVAVSVRLPRSSNNPSAGAGAGAGEGAGADAGVGGAGAEPAFQPPMLGNAAQPLSSRTLDATSRSILENALAAQPLPMASDGRLVYDPANDFDSEEAGLAALASPTSPLVSGASAGGGGLFANFAAPTPALAAGAGAGAGAGADSASARGLLPLPSLRMDAGAGAPLVLSFDEANPGPGGAAAPAPAPASLLRSGSPARFGEAAESMYGEGEDAGGDRTAAAGGKEEEIL